MHYFLVHWHDEISLILHSCYGFKPYIYIYIYIFMILAWKWRIQKMLPSHELGRRDKKKGEKVNDEVVNNNGRHKDRGIWNGV